MLIRAKYHKILLSFLDTLEFRDRYIINRRHQQTTSIEGRVIKIHLYLLMIKWLIETTANKNNEIRINRGHCHFCKEKIEAVGILTLFMKLLVSQDSERASRLEVTSFTSYMNSNMVWKDLVDRD